MKKIDRLCAFTDGVYAIAITLLIFSVTLHNTQEVFNDTAARELLRNIMMYAIGFIGIAMLWFSNHRTYAHITCYRAKLGNLTMIHLFFVVLIPAMTSITIRYEGQLLPNLFYIGAYLGAMLSQKAAAVYLFHHKMLDDMQNEKKEDLYDTIYQWVVNGYICGAVIFVFLSPWLSMTILIGGMIFAAWLRSYFRKKYSLQETDPVSGGDRAATQQQIEALISQLKKLQKNTGDQ